MLYCSLCSGPQDFKSVMCNEKSSWNFFFYFCATSHSSLPSPSFLPPPIQWFVFINFRQSRDVRVWNVGNKDFLNIGTVTRFDVWLLLLVGDYYCGNQNSKTEKKNVQIASFSSIIINLHIIVHGFTPSSL